MLVKLLPSQVVDNWEVLSYGIQQALPPITYESPKRMQKILESIMLNEMHVWVGLNNDQKIEGVIITCPIYEKNSDVNDLLIYTLYGYENLSYEVIKEGIATLKSYAKSKGMKRITAYSNVDSVIRLFQALGGQEEWKYISIPANGVM